MNQERRDELNEVTDLLGEASDRLREIIDEEQQAYDDLPEGLQYSRTGESMLNAIDQMETFDDHIHKVSDEVEDFIKPKRKKKDVKK